MTADDYNYWPSPTLTPHYSPAPSSATHAHRQTSAILPNNTLSIFEKRKIPLQPSRSAHLPFLAPPSPTSHAHLNLAQRSDIPSRYRVITTHFPALPPHAHLSAALPPTPTSRSPLPPPTPRPCPRRQQRESIPSPAVRLLPREPSGAPRRSGGTRSTATWLSYWLSPISRDEDTLPTVNLNEHFRSQAQVSPAQPAPTHPSPPTLQLLSSVSHPRNLPLPLYPCRCPAHTQTLFQSLPLPISLPLPLPISLPLPLPLPISLPLALAYIRPCPYPNPVPIPALAYISAPALTLPYPCPPATLALAHIPAPALTLAYIPAPALTLALAYIPDPALTLALAYIPVPILASIPATTLALTPAPHPTSAPPYQEVHLMIRARFPVLCLTLTLTLYPYTYPYL
nr:vegetative cell wall protein gp1-like [Penaeus vannamei]